MLAAGGIGNNGNDRWHYFKKVVAAPSLTNVAGQFDFGGLATGDVWKALIIFLYVSVSASALYHLLCH